ncbi:alkaline phosphatase family protein [Streptomyces sp. S6]|nr:alkaline phosphatase family protein [Streptomyces sp. S6]
MAGLRLGPLLRYVDHESGSTATVWAEASRPCTVEVRCADGASGASPTFAVAGAPLRPLGGRGGLTPGTTTAYGTDREPARLAAEDSSLPPSTITTRRWRARQPGRTGRGGRGGPGASGPAPPSASRSAPAAGPRPADGHDPAGPDALVTLAARLAADPAAERPDVLLLLGDQVYADETSGATRRRLAARRDLREPPGAEVADYEEYTCLYDESWRDPEVRWLLSTVPSCMIFDDHDVIDDWNTSAAWQEQIRATPWWHERIVSGLMSYWVYQHLGNLSPAELAADPLYATVRAVPDGTEALRRSAAGADADPARTRWSYQRIFGRVQLLMVDTRAARVLPEGRRAMLDDGEAAWLREKVLADPSAYDHILIGSSLPWLLPPLAHDAETWNAALCGGSRGGRWARFGEKVRRAADLEHWAAFPDSFDRFTELLRRAGSGPEAPATVCVLSGDVHHAYIAEPRWPDTAPGGAPESRVLQLTCSPLHNSVPRSIRWAFRFGWSGVGRSIGRLLIRHGRTEPSPVSWSRTGGPWFGNQLMTLTLRGRNSALTLVQAKSTFRNNLLVKVLERSLTKEP